ncbi:MAG TPA: CsbD family protein [Rhizomicrobium sp.]|jgi:uncharacterized protein YjbJ (UPF0337 family)
MDKFRIEGNTDRIKGAVKVWAGRILGSDRLRAEGQADKAKGHIKQAAGKAADMGRRGMAGASRTIRKAIRH